MEYRENSLKQLLSQVNTINEAYKIVKKNTGEDFNIFKILGMERKEVKTHSKFLAELLNPKGSHLQGNIFLKLFAEYLNNVKTENVNNSFNLLDENPINLNFQKSNVSVEKYIGEKTCDTGGRIDIAIEDSEGRLICIENKIDAGEQENQLLRYYNYCKKFKYHLLFLTLDGKETKTFKISESKVYAISYKKHIVEWLELCKKETVNLPILRESIGQYINLIKKLTNQTTNTKMAKDIVEIIADNSKNFESSKLIKENFDNAVQLLVDKQRDCIINLLIDNNFDASDISIERCLRNDGFFLKLKNFELENEIYELGLNFELGNNYYFFCMIKQGQNRDQRINNNEIFDDIRNTIHNAFRGYNLESNGWTIGKSENFKIGIVTDQYFYPETNNDLVYKNLVDSIVRIKNVIDSLFN
ncbi:PD-(D/E)XK nuclease family protein [Chryseobacterium sp. NEB161]|nr:PD-(D/E)XK nuclease family protein [Chryseobacterium sp. NEB161]